MRGLQYPLKSLRQSFRSKPPLRATVTIGEVGFASDGCCSESTFDWGALFDCCPDWPEEVSKENDVEPRMTSALVGPNSVIC